MVLLLVGLRLDAGIVDGIQLVAENRGIDPKLALAIATVESSLNPKAIGKHGEVGLFQIHPGYHSLDLFYKDELGYSIGLLIKVKQRCKELNSAWFVCWNTGFKGRPKSNPKSHPYYKRVIAEYVRL